MTEPDPDDKSSPTHPAAERDSDSADPAGKADRAEKADQVDHAESAARAGRLWGWRARIEVVATLAGIALLCFLPTLIGKSAPTLYFVGVAFAASAMACLCYCVSQPRRSVAVGVCLATVAVGLAVPGMLLDQPVDATRSFQLGDVSGGAVTKDTTYIATGTTIVALAADGREKWRFAHVGLIGAVSEDGYVLALDASISGMTWTWLSPEGAVLWTATEQEQAVVVGGEPFGNVDLVSPIAAANGVLVVVGGDPATGEQFIGIGPDGSTVWTAPRSTLLSDSERGDFAAMTRVTWESPAGLGSGSARLPMAVADVMSEGVLSLFAADTGALQQQVDLGEGDVSAVTVLGDRLLWQAAHGLGGCEIHRLDLNSGTSTVSPAPSCITDGYRAVGDWLGEVSVRSTAPVFSVSTDDVREARPPNGAVIVMAYDDDSPFSHLSIASDAGPTEPTEVILHSRVDGAPLWSAQLETSSVRDAAYADGRVAIVAAYPPSANPLAAFRDEQPGTVVWSFDADSGAVVDRFVVHGDYRRVTVLSSSTLLLMGDGRLALFTTT